MSRSWKNSYVTITPFSLARPGSRRGWSRWCILLSVFCLSVGSKDLKADLLAVHVTGRVTDWDGGLGTQFSVGDKLDLTYTYDLNAPDQEPFASLGIYAFTGFS